MSVTGTVKNGVVVLPQDAGLAEGTTVIVQPLTTPTGAAISTSTVGKFAQALADLGTLGEYDYDAYKDLRRSSMI